MTPHDDRVDAYIRAAAPFAQPLLAHLRQAVHAACPGCTEDIKWGMPFFLLNGRPLAHMAAFKQHCAFGFWRGREAASRGHEGEAMGQFGRITSKADLPPAREFAALVRAAVARAQAEAETPRAAKPASARPRKPVPAVPADLAAALARAKAALAAFEALAPGQQREFLEWVLEAKRDETRQRRIEQTVLKLAAGAKRP